MNEELIKRIDDKLSVICPYDEEGERTRDFDTWAILYDCRAALTRKYVPMTDAEIWELFLRHDGDRVASLAAIQSEVIRRAGMEVQK